MREYAPDNLERCCSGAGVRRECDTKQYVMNGYPSGQPIRTGEYQYFCQACDRRLSFTLQDRKDG